MEDLLDRVSTMLGYIELLGRALTPSEIQRVHDLQVEVEGAWASMGRELKKKRASLILSSTVAYRDEATDRYHELHCLEMMKGRAIPASLEEVGPLDPGCICGAHILSQAERSWYYELVQRAASMTKKMEEQ